MVYKIPLTRPSFGQEEILEIERTLASGWVAGQGPKGKEFAAQFAKVIGAEHAHPVSSCTAALHLSLLALDIGEGDEVLVPDFTFPATAHATLYVGAKPRFIDVDLKTYNLDPERVKEQITERIKAIIPVHMFGQAAEMGEIMKIAKQHSLKVVEDCACAAGAHFQNQFVGTFGDIGCFSFHARKNITSGEGGMVVTQDRGIFETVQQLSFFGIQSAFDRQESQEAVIPEVSMVGYNYKMSDLQAALGLAQLKKLPAVIKRKQELAKYYDEQLEKLEFVQPPFVAKGCEHIYQSYVCVLDKKINRNRVMMQMKKQGIQTQFGTYACSVQPVYKTKNQCPNSVHLFKQSLALPMFYDLTFEEMDTVLKALRACLGS